MSTATAPTGGGPFGIAIDTTGNYVYVTNNTSNTMSEYSIGANGALTLVGSAATGSGPLGLAIY
jgi:6-phosphogluconolactonase